MAVFFKSSGFVHKYPFFLILIGFLFHGLKSFSQPPQKPARILFLLDASGSMTHNWQGQESRFQVAAQIIGTIMDSIYKVNPGVAFGLRVFGEQYPAKDSNCYDTKLEVPFGYYNKNQILRRLQYLRPRGFSPIALSLQKAAEEDFKKDNRFSYSIILLTDGGESCGGDICATVQNLLDKKISFTPYILTLVDYKPLEKEYDCLGKVLTVSKEKDINPAVKKIVGDNRKILTVKSVASQRKVKPPHQAPVKPVTKPKVTKTQPPPPPPKPKPEKPKNVTPTPPPATTMVVTKVDKLAVNKVLDRQNLLFTLPHIKPYNFDKTLIHLPYTNPEDYNKPTMTPIKTVPQHRKTVRNHATIANKEKLKVYTTQEDAQKTTVQIYFTNGHGKFYYTTPQIKFLNSQTQKKVKEFIRSLSGHQPNPVPIKEGTYDIVIPGSRAKALNVHLVANKTNKVYIKAGNASLGFYYSTHPNRPVTEYKAYVSNRFGNRKVTTQSCDTLLPYPPANYHIEINTLPKMVLNVNLNFNALKMITIPTPGVFQINNTHPLREPVRLYHNLGGAYTAFANMKIKGNPQQQEIRLLPGWYQVRYFKQPHKPYDKPKVIRFRIKSDQKTSITLAP